MRCGERLAWRAVRARDGRLERENRAIAARSTWRPHHQGDMLRYFVRNRGDFDGALARSPVIVYFIASRLAAARREGIRCAAVARCECCVNGGVARGDMLCRAHGAGRASPSIFL